MRQRRVALARVLRLSTLVLASVTIMVVAGWMTHQLGASGEVAGGGSPSEAGEGSALFPPILGPIGALIALAIIWLFARRRLHAAWFVVLPPTAFIFQELAERLSHASSLPLLGDEPSLVASILLQVPFALMAVGVAWILLTVARRAVRLFKVAPRPRLVANPSSVRIVAGEHLQLRSAWAGAHFGRAPPSLN